MALAFDGVRGSSPLTPDARGAERSPPVFTPRPRSSPTGRRGVAHGIRLTAYEWCVSVPERRADAADGVADATRTWRTLGRRRPVGTGRSAGTGRSVEAWRRGAARRAARPPAAHGREERARGRPRREPPPGTPTRPSRRAPRHARAARHPVVPEPPGSPYMPEPEAPTRSRGRLRLRQGPRYCPAGGAACPDGAFSLPGTRTRSTSLART